MVFGRETAYLLTTFFATCCTYELNPLIRYNDGSEELYNHKEDPMEWRNLAMDSKHAEIKAKVAKYLPKETDGEVTKSRKRNKK